MKKFFRKIAGLFSKKDYQEQMLEKIIDKELSKVNFSVTETRESNRKKRRPPTVFEPSELSEMKIIRYLKHDGTGSNKLVHFDLFDSVTLMHTFDDGTVHAIGKDEYTGKSTILILRK
jgi:hypothetical protein